MKTRALGRTSLEVTELGFGGGGIGGLYAPVSREDAMATMQAAWDVGMRYFDTAPFYGHGLSERRVGDFLRNREGYTLSTKVGKLLRPVPQAEVPDFGFVDPLPFTVDFDYSHDAILRSVEFSLARLGLNRIDVVYVHDLEEQSLGAAYPSHLRAFLDSGLKSLERLKGEGVIAGWGLGVNEASACLNVLRRAPLDCLLLAGRYTLLDRRAEAEVLPLCKAQGTAVVIGGVFNSGILATGPVPGAHFDYVDPSPDILHRVRGLEAAAHAQGATLASAAVRFALDHQAVASVLIGSAKPSSIVRSAALLDASPAELNWSAFAPFALH